MILSHIGTFKLTLQFTEDYPNKPPVVRFVSRMFHPNSMSHNLIIWPLHYLCKLLHYSQEIELLKIYTTNCFCYLFSLCRWKYLLGYPTKSMEPYIWCCCDIDLYPGIIWTFAECPNNHIDSFTWFNAFPWL